MRKLTQYDDGAVNVSPYPFSLNANLMADMSVT
jgi:hypothetical protein